jgi:hypothetical protein
MLWRLDRQQRLLDALWPEAVEQHAGADLHQFRTRAGTRSSANRATPG